MKKPSHIAYVLCIFMATTWRENTLKNMCGDLKFEGYQI